MLKSQCNESNNRYFLPYCDVIAKKEKTKNEICIDELLTIRANMYLENRCSLLTLSSSLLYFEVMGERVHSHCFL